MARSAKITRRTAETSVELSLELDGSGTVEINSGIGFFDHMLTQLALHGMMDLKLKAAGDLEVDEHHTVEDVGICLGQALAEALGDRSGIARYGQALVPMDEALVEVALDLSRRPILVTTGSLPGQAGGFSGQLAVEFMRALANHGGITLHVAFRYGTNDHHILEAAFKALGQALYRATRPMPGREGVGSSKGVL